MGPRQLKSIRRWFEDYTSDYYRQCGKLHQLELKERHSRRVAENAGLLADDLDWDDSDRCLAVAAGLLHDIGRFPQYRDYGTFYDFKSVDHGDRGEQALREDFPKNLLSPKEFELIAMTIREHNKKDLPQLPPEDLAMLRIVKDSDKIDIYKVVREHIQRGEQDAIYPGLGPEGDLSLPIIEGLLKDKKARYDQLRTLSDVLLFQLCWVHDMAHRQSTKLLWNRGDLEWLIDRIPNTTEVKPVISQVMEEISRATDG
nr:HD domain-containing protein [uncultured Dethiosulfovibrio sp.]